MRKRRVSSKETESVGAYGHTPLRDADSFRILQLITRGKHLRLRDNASTMVSQFIDTFTVNTIFLYDNSTVFRGDFGDLMPIIPGVHVIKVAIAALDIPCAIWKCGW